MLEFVWFETFFCNRKNVSVRAKNGGFEFGHFEFSTKTRIWPLLKSLFVQNKTLSDEKNVSHRPRYRIDKNNWKFTPVSPKAHFDIQGDQKKYINNATIHKRQKLNARGWMIESPSSSFFIFISSRITSRIYQFRVKTQ